MPKIEYQFVKFKPDTVDLINKANEIIEDYQSQGYSLTLRQLYYQFVSRDLIRNTQQEYKRLGSIVNDGRMAGLIDWDAIEDRTRNVHRLAQWESPNDIVTSCSTQYRIDKWGTQPCRIEVWIEKEALAGVFQRVCDELQVPFFSCRGYASQSEMWAAGRRLKRIAEDEGKEAIILHFGDHDPSGIDMSRDIKDRLLIFMDGEPLRFKRLALTMDQVDEYRPPPNPAKTTDARFNGYADIYGDESWELDALEPDVLADLVRQAVLAERDDKAWEEALAQESRHKAELRHAAANWTRMARRWRITDDGEQQD